MLCASLNKHFLSSLYLRFLLNNPDKVPLRALLYKPCCWFFVCLWVLLVLLFFVVCFCGGGGGYFWGFFCCFVVGCFRYFCTSVPDITLCKLRKHLFIQLQTKTRLVFCRDECKLTILHTKLDPVSSGSRPFTPN